MNFSNKNLEKFLEIIKEYENIDDILEKCKNQSEKGFVYERLWDLVIKFGLHPDFLNCKYDHMLGNVNKGKLSKMTSLEKYINENNVVSGNSGGCSDITLKNKETGEYIFISCKYPKSEDETKKSKNVEYYDVQKI